jgi:glucose/arabinose dehydrogenase
MNACASTEGFVNRRHATRAVILFSALLFGAPPGPVQAAGVPSGFRIAVLARVPDARAMTVCGNTLYVGTKGSAVYAVPLNKQGAAKRVIAGLPAPNGVACHDGQLYVAMRDRVSAWSIGAGGELSGARRDVMTGLPNKAHHGLRYIGFGPDGRLYVSLGSPCNICEPQGMEGTILRVGPDGSGRETVATGIRNSVGFDWDPGSHVLFFTDNGADLMGDNRPPDELNAIRRNGGWYGFPYFGGTERLTGYANRQPPREQIPPVFNFPAHVATLGVHFYTGGMFPAEYRGSAFVAEHGSWNRSVPDGYQVVMVRFRDGRPVGQEPFATGLGRPVDVKELPDGSLAISADSPGLIYRVTYGGEP